MMKKLSSYLVLLSMLCSLSLIPALASDVNDTQEQINETLAEVFEYLNSQSFSLLQFEDRTYTIPVNNETVTVHVTNEQLQPKTRGSFIDYYPIKPNSPYVFTATIDDFYLGSGSVVLKVSYNVLDPYPYPDDDMYKLAITNASISATPPTGYSIGPNATSFDNRGDSSVAFAYGFVDFTSPSLKDFTFTINLRLTSIQDSKLAVQYVWET